MSEQCLSFRHHFESLLLDRMSQRLSVADVSGISRREYLAQYHRVTIHW